MVEQKQVVAKPKKTSLKPWQTKITREEYISTLEKEGRFSGVAYDKDLNVYYKTNMSHPEKIKQMEAKQKRKDEKKAKKRKIVDSKIESALKKGKKIGVKEFKTSEKFAKIIKQAEIRGAKQAKPKLSQEERIKKKKEKLAKLQKEIEAQEKSIKKA